MSARRLEHRDGKMPRIMDINPEDINSPAKCSEFAVSIIECGKVDLSLACDFADAGFRVIGVNANPHIMGLLKKGKIPFADRRAYHRLEEHQSSGVLSVSSDVRKAAQETDIIIVTKQTTDDGEKKLDHSRLERMCKDIGMGLRSGSLILLACSVGIGMVEDQIRDLFERASGLKAGVDFGLAYSPTTVDSPQSSDGSRQPRIVGAIDKSSLRTASLVLSKVSESKVIEVTNIRTAAALDLFRDAGTAVSLALANELAFLCAELKIDFHHVLEVAKENNLFDLSFPGLVDDSARRNLHLLAEEAEEISPNLRLILSAGRINDEIVSYTFRMVKDALKACGKTVRRSKVSILGVSGHPNVKDAPSCLTKSIIDLMKRKVRRVQVYDPFFSKSELAKHSIEGEKLSKVVEDSDCIVVLAGHTRFRRLNLKRIGMLAKRSPSIVDIGLVIDPQKAKKYGFVYRGLGRGL